MHPVLPDGSDQAADALAAGALVGHGFANFCALTARGDDATIRAVNAVKGRPSGQVGSTTGSPELITTVLGLDRLPISHATAEALMAALFALARSASAPLPPRACRAC